MTRPAWFGLATLLLAWLGLSLWHFDVAFLFHGDHERDLRYATLLVQHGVWPESSPSISPTPYELGPLLYLILAPAVAISPDPFVVRVWYLLLAGAGLALLMVTLSRRVRWEAALLAVFALTASTFVYELSRQLWHSSLLVLPTAGILWGLQRGDQRGAMTAAACAAIAVQLHMAMVGFVLVVLVWAAVRKKPRELGMGVGVFLVALTPFLVTLVGTVWSGTTAPASSASEWAPAGPTQVLSFFVENVHTVWGDNLGPWLTWPIVVAMVIGAVVSWRRSGLFGRTLVGLVAVGFVVESLLLGNQTAHRYMHANMIPAFLLVAWTADAALARWPKFAYAAAAMALAITVEAAISGVPHAVGGGWLSAAEQREVARVVATELALEEDVMERRVHGIYFGEPMGMGHLHTLYKDPASPAFSESLHVIVMPSDLNLRPHGAATGAAWRIKGAGRETMVYAYEPAMDYTRMTVEGPSAKWRRPAGGQRGAQKAIIRVPVERPGTVNVTWAGRCGVSAWSAGHPVKVSPTEAPRYRWLSFATVPAGVGELVVQVGPCQGLAFVDVF